MMPPFLSDGLNTCPRAALNAAVWLPPPLPLLFPPPVPPLLVPPHAVRANAMAAPAAIAAVARLLVILLMYSFLSGVRLERKTSPLSASPWVERVTQPVAK